MILNSGQFIDRYLPRNGELQDIPTFKKKVWNGCRLITIFASEFCTRLVISILWDCWFYDRSRGQTDGNQANSKNVDLGILGKLYENLLIRQGFCVIGK